MISDTLKKKMGVRNYKILCSAIVVALFAVIAVPILSNKQDESFAADSLFTDDNIVEVKFLNTQQNNNYIKLYSGNEANLIRVKDNGGDGSYKYILIDTGNEDSGIRKTIYNALKSWQNNKDNVVIDYLIISHSHGDHIGNAKKIISATNIDVKNLVIKREGMKIDHFRRAKEKGTYDGEVDYLKPIINACVEKDSCKHIYSNSSLGQITVNGRSYDYGFRNNVRKNSNGKETHREKLTGEGDEINVSDYLSLYFYNTRDIYSSSTAEFRDENNYSDRLVADKNGYICRKYYATTYWSDVEKAKSKDGGELATKKDGNNVYYRRFNTGSGSNAYPKVQKEWATKLEKGSSNKFDNKYLYEVFRYKKDSKTDKYLNEINKYTSCSPNGNSYGVLAEVKPKGNNGSSNNYKYIYFANDLDNFGYDVFGTETKVKYYNKKKELTNKTVKVYGNGRGVLLNSTDLGAKNNKVGTRVAPETRTALEIADKLGDNNLENIVIYQQSHHGYNNAPDAVQDILKMNNKNIYAIANTSSEPGSGQDFVYLRSYYYTLNKLDKHHNLFTGITRKNSSGKDVPVDGVSCAINANGDTGCGYKKLTLTYNANGGTGAPGKQICFSTSRTKTDSCATSISSTKPTRSNYKFLGWSESSSATKAKRLAGEKDASISGDTTLYAVWQKQVTYTLTYDANGGTGAPANQTCVAVNDGTCSLKVSNTTPTRSGYTFAGWDTVTTTLDGTYKPGSTIVLNVPTRTLYAIWRRVVNVNTSVNGTGGRISSSMTGIEQGTTVTITFTPNAGYEIDNVKVDGETVTVTDNSIDITVADEDMNVVVTFKQKAVDPTPTPDPDDPTPDPTRTFALSFSSNNGGSGFPTRQTCTTTTDSCMVTIPEDPEPTRSGYVFLGYGLMSNRNEVVVKSGEYELTGNTSFIAIWAPVYTLTLDANSGTFSAGVETTLTCNPDTPNGTCTVTLPEHDNNPTKEGYEFFGWAISSDGNAAEYLPGQNYTFVTGMNNITLYALWESSDAVNWIQGQNYNKESGADLLLSINYPFDMFALLKIDNAIVDPSNYDVSSGSTRLAIHSDYVDTLSDGEHTMQAIYSNGVTANTAFTVITEQDDIPGDDDPDDDDPGDDDYDPTDPDTSDDPTNPDGADTPDSSTDPDDSDGPDPVDSNNPYNSDEDNDDYIPVPSTSAGTPDTGGNTGNNIGGDIAVMILPVVFAGLATLAYKRNINKTHRKFD